MGPSRGIQAKARVLPLGQVSLWVGGVGGGSQEGWMFLVIERQTPERSRRL